MMNASKEEKLDFFEGVKSIVMDEGLDQKGYKLHNNNLEVMNQTIPHFHMHILSWDKVEGKKECPNL